MTMLSVFLKQLRDRFNERLYDMAENLDCSSAFLSAVENGRKSLPANMAALIAKKYALTEDEKRRLEEAVNDSRTQLKIDLQHSTQKQREIARAFVEQFPNIPDSKIAELEKVLLETSKTKDAIAM